MGQSPSLIAYEDEELMIFFVEQGGELIRYWEDICISGWTAYKVKKYISQTFREASKERRAIY